MRYHFIIKGILIGFLTGNSLLGQTYETKVTSVSNVRMSVSNFGTYGNSFNGYRDGSGTPSCEYPANSGIEHLFEGGLWIGGRRSGGDVLVTTTAIDMSSGYSAGAGGFESMASTPLEEKSSFFNSRLYSPEAVSHQDFVATFNDTTRFYPGTSIRVGGSTHEPMGIEATVKTYNWNYTFSDFIVFVDITYRNVGQNSYSDVYLGLWNNTVVRNINVTPAGSGGSDFYNKGGNGYMDSLNLAYCFDAAGDLGFTESYVGQVFLGASDKEGFHHPDIPYNYNPLLDTLDLDNFKSGYQAWVFNNFTAEFAAPRDDGERYNKLSQGLNESPCWTNPGAPDCPGNRDYQALLRQAGNRSDLITAGPFGESGPGIDDTIFFDPGDEITVSYAYIFAKKVEDGNPTPDNTLAQRQTLIDRALFAQETFNGEDVNFNGILDEDEDTDGDGKISRFILPSPPATPFTKVVPENGKMEIYWSDNSEFSVDPISDEMDFEGYRIYLSKIGFDVTGTADISRDLNLVAQYDIEGNGFFFETGFESIALDEPKYFEGDTVAYKYKYTIQNVSNGWQYAVSVTAFDRGDAERNIESLESSPLANDLRIFSGTVPNEDMDKSQPFVYPNPYYYGAAWEGRSNFQEESRKLLFANLPERCVIRIYTEGGDFIDEIRHDQNYNGSDIRWYRTFAGENSGENVFSGGEHAWDLLSSESQIISRGLYMFSVEDLDSGKKSIGKFVIIK